MYFRIKVNLCSLSLTTAILLLLAGTSVGQIDLFPRNQNNICWTGTGSSPTIDSGITLCTAFGSAIREDISPTYTGADSANITTTSFGAKVYSGSGIIFDNRQNLGTIGSIGSTNLYPILFGGREMGALAVNGVNRFNTGTIADSTCAVCDTNFIGSPSGATFPSNSGEQVGHIGFATTTDKITVGSSQSIVAGGDFEGYNNASTQDANDVLEVAGGTFSSGITRSGLTGTTATASAVHAGSCANASAGTAKIANCYTVNAVSSETLASIANYSYHAFGAKTSDPNGSSSGSLLLESNSAIDALDAGFNINSLSEASSTVTVTTAATCNFITGTKVRISGTGTNNFNYNGMWTVLTPGCNGGSTFTYTNTVSGLGSLGAGGVVAGVHRALAFNSSDKIVHLVPLQDTTGWSFDSNGGGSFHQIKNTGIFVTNQVSPASDSGAFLGGSSLHWAGIFQTECQLGGATGTASPAACSGATSGMIAIPASQATYTVNTTNVTTNSLIFVQQMTDNSGLPSSPTCNSGVTAPIQSARLAGTSFTFTLTSVASVTCIKFWLVN